MESMGRLGRYTAVASRRVNQGEFIGGCRGGRAAMSSAMIDRHELGEGRELSPGRLRLLQALMVISLAAVMLTGCLSLHAPSAIASSTFPATASLDTFERAAESPLSDGGKWSKLGWTKTIGRVFSSTFGWVPKEGGAGASESEADGTYWNAASFASPAVSVHMYPENLHDYVALWCDTTGTGSKNGYRLKVVGVGSNDAFKLILEKWVNDAKTVLAESSEIDFASGSHENTIGLTAMGGKVQGWYGTTEASLGVKIEASDSTFTSGDVGIEGTNDSAYGETKYRAGAAAPPANTTLPALSNDEGWSSWREGQVVTASTGSWTGAEPISYSYQWESCNTEGASCENISGATTSTFTPAGSNVGHTLRVVVTATNIYGASKATSAATPQLAAQSSPEAHVLNSAGQAVQSYGNSYAGEPGGQIQQAENYAHTFGYPKVTLDSGAFTISVPYGRGHPVWPQCEGIFAYSAIALQGVSGSVIKNRVEASNPCGYEGWGKLTDLVFVGAEPANINTQASSLNVSAIKLQSESDSEYGLRVDGTSGPGLTVNGIVSTGATASDISIGIRGLPVVGTEGSPAQIVNDTAELGENEGIVVEGSHITVADNKINEIAAHGIAVYGTHSTYVEVSHNTVTSASWGVSLDASELNEQEQYIASGEDDAVYDNNIEDTCVGTVLFRQSDTDVAGNYYADPSTGWQAKKIGDHGSQGCPEFPPTGVAISNSCVNGVWANQVWYYRRGVEVFDGEAAPSVCGGRTTANYVGRVLEVGKPWPWKIEGNWINSPQYGFFAEIWPGDSPVNVSGNEFAGNVVDNASLGGWDWTNPEISEILYENSFG
jgi:hypothetical protein